jgi:hypothetical protein
MLKAMHVTVLAGAMGAALLLVPTAQAADPGFCHDYAEAAVRQVRGGLNYPRCVPGMRGARWSADFRVHFEWCRGVSREEADQERDVRTEFLRRCR